MRNLLKLCLHSRIFWLRLTTVMACEYTVMGVLALIGQAYAIALLLFIAGGLCCWLNRYWPAY